MKKEKKDKLKITYKFAEGISEEDVQRRLDKAFDIIFTEVTKSKS